MSLEKQMKPRPCTSELHLGMKYPGCVDAEAAGIHPGTRVLVPSGTYLEEAPLLPLYLSGTEVASILEGLKEPMV